MTGHAETKFCTISYTYKEKFSKKYTKECDKQKTKYRQETLKQLLESYESKKKFQALRLMKLPIPLSILTYQYITKSK